MDDETCVIVMNEDPCHIYQDEYQAHNIPMLNRVAKVCVNTETDRKKRDEENKWVHSKEISSVSESIDVHVPLLSSAPKDLGGFPPHGIFQGYVHTMKAVKKLLDQYESQSSTRFILYSRTNSFGDGDWMEGKHRVAWEIVPNCKPGISLPFQGVPFFIVGHSIYDCQHGRRRKPSKRIKQTEEAVCESRKKRKGHQQNSIKIGCPAQLLMREVIMFPEFKLTSDTLKRRQLMSQKVRKSIQLHIEGRDMIQTERRIYIYFPRGEEHLHHKQSVDVNSPPTSGESIHPSIIQKIHSLVFQGTTGVKMIREHVEDFVKDMFQDGSHHPVDNRRYNPTDQDIRYAIKKARAEMRKAQRKSLEMECASLMNGIQECLPLVKSEKYLTQLRDHLGTLETLVKNEKPLDPLLQSSQVNDENIHQLSPAFKKVRSYPIQRDIREPPTLPVFTTEYHERDSHITQKPYGIEHPSKTINLKQNHDRSLIDIPEVDGVPTYTCSSNYDKVIYHDEVSHSQAEAETKLYYYQKGPSRQELYATECNQVPYNVTEFMKNPPD